MAAKIFRINYKSDFILTMNSDAGWAIPFCIKFWTSVPSRAYFVGFDGTTYTHCAYDPSEPTKLVVQFDDHHLPIGDLNYQIAYHFTVADFPNDTEDEVINPASITTEIDGETYQVMLDFTGETAPEIEFNLPAYANEAERIQNELQRQQNEADRIAAELQREQATAAAVQGAENVNAQLNGTTLTVTNRQGVSTSVNTKGEQGEQGPVGPEGPQGQTGVSITGLVKTGETETDTLYNATFSDGTTQAVAIPKGAKGDTGATGPTGPQGPQGQTGASITGLVKTGETETDTLYNVTFSNGTTQAVAIPKGAKGDQGEQGPQGPQGPMGDVAVITPEQQAAFTMYSETGQNTDGPMTQKAVTDNLVAGSISYDNSTSRFASSNVQDVLDEVGEDIDDIHSNVFATGLIDANCSWCSLGTSITWYNNHVSSSFTKGYQTRVMEKIKFSSFINGGINGGTMATGGGKTGLGDSLSTISLADFYTIEHGINDWGTGIPVGTMDDYVNDTGTSTFMGAYRKVIDYIKGLNSDAKIILCTPRKAYGFNNYLPAYWYAPKNGIYLKDYVDAVKEIAEYESLVVCDWFAESGANQDNLANLSIDVALHPNDKGYEAMANLLISSMRKIFNIFETDSIYIGEGGAKKQTVLPSLSSGGTGWINKNGTTLGPSIAALRNSIITKIFSSVSKTGTMIVRVINPNTQTIINTYTVTGFSGTEMDVSSLNMNVPKGCYVLFGNQITSGTVNSMFAFVTNAGTPHTEASVSEIRLDRYPTMSITLGYELTSV